MNPSVDVGCPPRPFRHLRMAQRRTPDLSSSRAPVHSALVQKSVTAITNPAGRLSIWMLGKSHALGKWKTANSWQVICNQSNSASDFRLLAPGSRKAEADSRVCGMNQPLHCLSNLWLYTRDAKPHPRALGPRNLRRRFVETMLKYRASAVAAAAILVVAHIVLLLLRFGTETASVGGDWLAGVAVLLATLARWLASRGAGPFAKRVWRLVAFSAFLAFVGRGFYTYYYDYAHISLDTI